MKLNIKKHVQFGNKKLPKTTMIFNCGSATNCPSKKLGLCQAGKHCYAKKAELCYPQVLPYRKRQNQIITKYKAETIANELLDLNKHKRKKIKTFRFNESGDFKNQKILDKMTKICSILSKNGIKCYGYTARTDLKLSKLNKVASVNVSNDKNNWNKKGLNRFKMVEKHTPKSIRCKGDCRICKICTKSNGLVIEVLKH